MAITPTPEFYQAIESIPVDTIAESGQIWGHFEIAIDSFAPFDEPPASVLTQRAYLGDNHAQPLTTRPLTPYK